MNKAVLYFFQIAIGLILFVIFLFAWNKKESDLIFGILLLYSGSIFLIRSIPKRNHTMYGLRFRGILTGIIAIIVGIVFLFSYFK